MPDQLVAGRGNRLIKIVTGIRRCGKSHLIFKLFTLRWICKSGAMGDADFRIRKPRGLSET